MANEVKSREVRVTTRWVSSYGGPEWESYPILLLGKEDSLDSLIGFYSKLIKSNARKMGRDVFAEIYDHVDIVVRVAERFGDGETAENTLIAGRYDADSLFSEDE